MNTIARWVAIGLLRLNTKAKAIPWIANLYSSLTYDDVNSSMFANFREHDRMLADNVRLDPYYRAISKYVGKGDVVVDIGTGTGILSFFAAQQGPKKIYAIDHSSIIDVAKTVDPKERV
jgi:protein arginine N-methyltransferase 1